MKIVIAGGHGKIALLLAADLRDHDVVSLVRDARQFADVAETGATPVLFDLANSTPQALAVILAGADAVVFSAGAGGGSTTEQKYAIDLGGAILLADAAELAGIRRYVLVSSMGTDSVDRGSDDPFQIYLRVKSDADADIRARDLDWTIIRPSALVDTPATGLVEVGRSVGRGTIPRADVAAVIARALVEGAGIRRQFELRSGADAIADVALDDVALEVGP
jgi:uncharacterized protein YbjT (DUF2867 family)